MNGATAGVVVGLLADGAPHDTGPDFGKASPFGLAVVVVLLICTCLLVWSMNRHLRKLPESFDKTSPETDQSAGEGTVETNDHGEPRDEPGG